MFGATVAARWLCRIALARSRVQPSNSTQSIKVYSNKLYVRFHMGLFGRGGVSTLRAYSSRGAGASGTPAGCHTSIVGRMDRIRAVALRRLVQGFRFRLWSATSTGWLGKGRSLEWCVRRWYRFLGTRSWRHFSLPLSRGGISLKSEFIERHSSVQFCGKRRRVILLTFKTSPLSPARNPLTRT